MVRLVQAFIYIRKHDGDNQYARPVPFVPIYNPAEKKVGLLNKCLGAQHCLRMCILGISDRCLSCTQATACLWGSYMCHEFGEQCPSASTKL